MKRTLRAAAVAVFAIAGMSMAAVPAFAAGPPAVGGQTNMTATVTESFTVVGFPTSVNFGAVAPGATTAGAASPYSITTNAADGYTVTVQIDQADEAGPGFGDLSRTDDIMRGPGNAYIPLSADIGGDLTVQHADSLGDALGPVQQLVSDVSPVTIVSTTGPENGTVQYEDLFTLAIPGGSQASGSYTATLNYVLAVNA